MGAHSIGGCHGFLGSLGGGGGTGSTTLSPTLLLSSDRGKRKEMGHLSGMSISCCATSGECVKLSSLYMYHVTLEAKNEIR